MADRIIIFDTSIFIDHLRTNKYGKHIQDVNGFIRNSSVVLAELSRGATSEAEKHFVATLAKNHPILTPTEKNWLESGVLLSKIYKAKGFDPEKLRDLHFDVLIALTARNYGAIVVTSNRTDFELIMSFKTFRIEVW
jgi:predicted nucleic acid-binding protein